MCFPSVTAFDIFYYCLWIWLQLTYRRLFLCYQLRLATGNIILQKCIMKLNSNILWSQDILFRIHQCSLRCIIVDKITRKVLVNTNINKHLSSFVDIWSSFCVNRRLCCPPPPYGCHLYHRPPLLWFLHYYKIRLMQLHSTWTQTHLLNSASIHLLLPCWCSASLTVAGKPISL